MTNPTSELASFIIDLEDEECPNFALHLAAYQVANIEFCLAKLFQDAMFFIIILTSLK